MIHSYISVATQRTTPFILLNPKFVYSIIQANGGSPPLTYAMFCQVTDIVGLPPRPCPQPDFKGVNLPVVDNKKDVMGIPTCEELGKCRSRAEKL